MSLSCCERFNKKANSGEERRRKESIFTESIRPGDLLSDIAFIAIRRSSVSGESNVGISMFILSFYV